MNTSSALLIRDLLATGDKLHKLWTYFTDTPPEYAELSRELHAFYVAVSDLVSQTGRIKSLVEREDVNRGRLLKGICDSSALTLGDLEKFVKKNKPADEKPGSEGSTSSRKENGYGSGSGSGTGSGSRGGVGSAGRTPRTWRRFEAASYIYDLMRLKQLLILNQAATADFRSALSAAAQNRLEPGSQRHDFLAAAIFELMAGAVSVDADGEAKNQAQTPAPVEREKVLAIWDEYGVADATANQYQSEIATRLQQLNTSSLSRTKSRSGAADEPVFEPAIPLRKKKSKQALLVLETASSPTRSRGPLSILVDDRTQSHVAVLFAHHLRRTLSPPSATAVSAPDAYASNVLTLELCTSPTPQPPASATDAKLLAAFLKYLPPASPPPSTHRRSLFRLRHPSDLWTFDLIICAGYGGVPTHYSQARTVAEVLCFEDLCGVRKFSNPSSRSITTMSGKSAWERSEKEVLKGVTEFVNLKLKPARK